MLKHLMLIGVFCSFSLWSSADGDDSWAHVAMADASGKPLHIVLGAVPVEPHMASVSTSATRIFVDLGTPNDGISTPSTPSIHADFNMLELWKKIAEVLPQKIDAVYCDTCVIQFIRWNASVFTTIMEGCLKPGGSLFLPQMRLASEAPRHPVHIPFDPKTQRADLVLRDVDRTTLPWLLSTTEGAEKGTLPTFIVKGNGGNIVCPINGFFYLTPSYVMDTYLQESVTRHTGYEGYPDIGLTSREEFEKKVASFTYVQIKRKG